MVARFLFFNNSSLISSLEKNKKTHLSGGPHCLTPLAPCFNRCEDNPAAAHPLMHGFSHLIQSLSYSSGKLAAARELSCLSSPDSSAHGGAINRYSTTILRMNKWLKSSSEMPSGCLFQLRECDYLQLFCVLYIFVFWTRKQRLEGATWVVFGEQCFCSCLHWLTKTHYVSLGGLTKVSDARNPPAAFAKPNFVNLFENLHCFQSRLLASRHRWRCRG